MANTSLHEQGMACIAIRGGAVIAQAINHDRFGHHAEWRAMRDKIGADYVIVARWNGKASRPCINCCKLLIRHSVKRAVYADYEGNVVMERL
jgi:pyrimidine deaminase RibD-like protein